MTPTAGFVVEMCKSCGVHVGMKDGKPFVNRNGCQSDGDFEACKALLADRREQVVELLSKQEQVPFDHDDRLETFVRLVMECRENQRNFFRGEKTREKVVQCKDLERKVDEWCSNYLRGTR